MTTSLFVSRRKLPLTKAKLNLLKHTYF